MKHKHTVICHVCGGVAVVCLEKEINVSCGDYFDGCRKYSKDIGSTPLWECTQCGFASFKEVADWHEDRFRADIYNNDYYLGDRPFLEERPKKLAAWLTAALSPCSLLDYGGGNGQLARLLTSQGFEAACYDPFYGGGGLPQISSEVVTAFEVVEHVPDQYSLFREMASLCRRDGVIIFSTLLKTMHLKDDWWYASPRNGHISFHTKKSINLLLSRLSLHHHSLSREIHLAAFTKESLMRLINIKTISISADPLFHFTDRWSALK
ncbi:class I SAM-dependent methyltransferase [Paramagnetospirillum marisnigri]|uniref:class I SAM-dependent methyltransferase n=1 Tax=Paramagnetospirillum marisnigri TaxID=1285242 RepID=UPI000ACD7895|nr:class I SAM-dependent methyltransferase [Paramagnetospirillum marisnigri]